MSEKRPTPAEAAWEKAGYLDAAADVASGQAGNAPVVSAFALPVAFWEAYVRGRERWYLEHPEARA
jgi:hypothetical protein